MALEGAAGDARIEATNFCEPDLADELTAVALAPGAAARQLCKGLRPMGR